MAVGEPKPEKTCPRCKQIGTRVGLYALSITVQDEAGQFLSSTQPNVWQMVACDQCAWHTLTDYARKVGAL